MTNLIKALQQASLSTKKFSYKHILLFVSARWRVIQKRKNACLFKFLMNLKFNTSFLAYLL